MSTLQKTMLLSYLVSIYYLCFTLKNYVRLVEEERKVAKASLQSEEGKQSDEGAVSTAAVLGNYSRLMQLNARWVFSGFALFFFGQLWGASWLNTTGFMGFLLNIAYCVAARTLLLKIDETMDRLPGLLTRADEQKTKLFELVFTSYSTFEFPPSFVQVCEFVDSFMNVQQILLDKHSPTKAGNAGFAKTGLNVGAIVTAATNTYSWMSSTVQSFYKAPATTATVDTKKIE